MGISPAAIHSGNLPTLRSEWLGLLGAPAGWILQFFLIYPLTLAVCAGHTSLWLHACALLGFAAAVVGGLTALRNWRAADHASPREAPEYSQAPIGRARLMAIVGVMEGALFGILILAQWIAVITLDPCPK